MREIFLFFLVVIFSCFLGPCFYTVAQDGTHRDKDDPSRPHPILIYVHIPKTGGAFMRRYLREGLKQRNATMFSYGLGTRHGNSFLDWPAERQNRFTLVHGHFGYGIHMVHGWKLSELRTPTYLTMLRHPVDRILSQFYFEMRSPMGRIWNAKLPDRLAVPNSADLFAWLDDMATRRPANTIWSAHHNPVTQQMCCYVGDGKALEKLRFEGCIAEEVNLTTLRCAMQNLVSLFPVYHQPPEFVASVPDSHVLARHRSRG